MARTDNLRIVGVQAAVLIEGSADLQRETQDLRIVAVPEINAGAASLAFAAINPAVALGTFLAQWLLREPMMAANTREFHITGGWADPKVERVDRAAVGGGSAPPRPADPRGHHDEDRRPADGLRRPRSTPTSPPPSACWPQAAGRGRGSWPRCPSTSA